MNKKIIEILDDIVTLIALIGLICALGIITSGILSFVLFIATLVFFSIKLMITGKKIKNLDSNIDDETVENFENDLLTYSNDIAKIKLSTKKDDIEKDVPNSDKEEDVNTIETKLIVNTEVEIKDKEEIENENEFKLTDEELQKCIRKLGKGRKASDKAKALAKKYGYELKDGETFIAPKSK